MYAPRLGLSFCVVDDIVVFLDVQNDRYFALSPSLSKTLLTLRDAVASGASLDADAVRPLVEYGVLVEHGAAESWSSSAMHLPQREWQSNGERARPALLTRAWVAIAATLIRLRTQRFAQVIEGPRALTNPVRGHSPSRAIASFLLALRLFPRRLDCLPASLALRSYLTQLSVPCELVLGVSLKPFAAHCWIEMDGMVIGDTLERVGDYIPIRRLP